MALAWGCPVRDVLDRLDSYELSEWMAYESVEPFGERRADLQVAMLCCLLTSLFAKRVVPADEFRLCEREPDRPMAPEDIKAVLMAAWKPKGG